MTATTQRLLAWAQRNERHLGSAVFLASFIFDLLTFVLLDISLVNAAFIAYLAIAGLAILGTHYLYSRLPEHTDESPLYERVLRLVLPLAAQYAIGGLLSGCLIFYTKSATLAVSWPFLIFLLVVFLGNEIFRKYKERLTFQTVLYFFSLYGYAIFALPLAVHRLGPSVFLGSTLIAVVSFGVFLWILERVGHMRFVESLRRILAIAMGMVIIMVVSYFTSILPPIPLALKDSGIFTSLERTATGYVVRTEGLKPWYDLTPIAVNYVPGTSLYAYSAVFAPISFSAGVVHRWERYDEAAGEWKQMSMIAFPISGGRSGGYRGYSEFGNISAGKWRVYVETPNGQVIGRIRFNVNVVDTLPALKEIRL